MIEFVADDVPDIDAVGEVVVEKETVMVSVAVPEVDPDFVAEPLEEGDLEMTDVFEMEGLADDDRAPVNVPVTLSVRVLVAEVDMEPESVIERVDVAEFEAIADPERVTEVELEEVGETEGDVETDGEPVGELLSDTVGERDETKEDVDAADCVPEDVAKDD